MNKIIFDAGGAWLSDKPSALIYGALDDMRALDRALYIPSASRCYERRADGKTRISVAGAALLSRFGIPEGAAIVDGCEIRGDIEIAARVSALNYMLEGYALEALRALRHDGANESRGMADGGLARWAHVAVAERWERDEPMAHCGYESWSEFDEFDLDMRRMAGDFAAAGR